MPEPAAPAAPAAASTLRTAWKSMVGELLTTQLMTVLRTYATVSFTSTSLLWVTKSDLVVTRAFGESSAVVESHQSGDHHKLIA